MKLLLLTKEYPPHVYGGAGVHVDYLSRELSKLMSVEVRCFGEQSEEGSALSVRGFSSEGFALKAPAQLATPLEAAWRGIQFNAAGIDADLVHCHTWYSYLGGIMAKQLYGIPLVITVHSLEPLRPWKVEQLAGGYDYSCWIEKQALMMADAVIAVSKETKEDILTHFNIPEHRISVIHNGIDLHEYSKKEDNACLEKYGINLHLPYVLFVGRITRQKGIIHLVRAIDKMDPGFQIVLCAGAPDTPHIAREMQEAVSQAQERHPGIIWIHHMVERHEIISLYSGASVFICPSMYEPFGIINLEAMACGVPVISSNRSALPEIGGDAALYVDPDSSTSITEALVKLSSDSVLADQLITKGLLQKEKFSWDQSANHLWQSIQQSIDK
jgi:glycogen synthase